MQFKIGDRVRAFGTEYETKFNGEIGTVVFIDKDYCGVEFDTWDKGHGGSGFFCGKPKHCWIFSSDFNPILAKCEELKEKNAPPKHIIKKAVLSKENIRRAFEDYNKHIYAKSRIINVSNMFIHNLAFDNAYNKNDLRQLFRKSSSWNEELDAIVINGTRTHAPDPDVIYRLGHDILKEKFDAADERYYVHLSNCIAYFSEMLFQDAESANKRKTCLESIEKIAPGAYAPGKKPSRVFKAICEAVGVADERAGSEFQRLYAKFADELSSKKIDFKLYLSLNPAHFLTMSNPKDDIRGCTLTSCHSLNSVEYEYNGGCSGYARDSVTFIVFTASNPDEPETLNNRKTTRQLFFYEPGNGVLLQSRMYNTSGGTEGAQEESRIYRDLVQRELSLLENAPNLWNTMNYKKVHNEDHEKFPEIYKHKDFFGYADWEYTQYSPKISVRTDKQDSFHSFIIGAASLCLECGEEIDSGIYCDECICRCDICERHVLNEIQLSKAPGTNDETLLVCEECFEEKFMYCDECAKLCRNEDITEIRENDWYVCDDCLKEKYERCDDCSNYEIIDDMSVVYDEFGNELFVCERCLNQNYVSCSYCGKYYSESAFIPINDNGSIKSMCPDCVRTGDYDTCRTCDGYWHKSELDETGQCPKCATAEKTQNNVN